MGMIVSILLIVTIAWIAKQWFGIGTQTKEALRDTYQLIHFIRAKGNVSESECINLFRLKSELEECTKKEKQAAVKQRLENAIHAAGIILGQNYQQ